MEKHIHLYILFVFVVFIFALTFSAAEYVHCEHNLPDEMLDHAALTDSSVKGSLHTCLIVVFLLHSLIMERPSQVCLSLSSSDPCIHSETILSTVLRI
jgi:hypothetical protein